MRLNELPKIVAFSKARKRKGKGVGSGNGKTAGRGHKGGKARSGYSPAPCCCGVPFYRHLPIRGFSNYRFRTEYEIVDLQKLMDLGLEMVDKHVMADAGLIKHEDTLVKVLGSADLKNCITVIADKFSKNSISSIEKAGGKAVSLLEQVR